MGENNNNNKQQREFWRLEGHFIITQLWLDFICKQNCRVPPVRGKKQQSIRAS